MVHSTYLLDLRRESSKDLAFYPPHPDYSWAFDDIMVFAFSARQAGQSENSQQTTTFVAGLRIPHDSFTLMNGGLSLTSFISSQLQSGFNLHVLVLLNNTEGFLLALCKCARLRQMSGGREKRIHVSVLRS